MDDSDLARSAYRPTKNFTYRLPYKNLHMMWDIFNTLDEGHTGFIPKEDLGTALRAAGLIISKGQIEDLIYDNQLEETKEIGMDLYFILVARYYRDQSMMDDGELVDGTYIQLPKIGKARIIRVNGYSGDPENPSSMRFSCQVVVQYENHRHKENRAAEEMDIAWAQAKYSHTVHEYIRHHIDVTLHQLIASFAYQEEEMTNSAVHAAFLGIYTDISPATEKKKIYETDILGKVKLDKNTNKPIVRRHQQFIAPDEIIKKKLCNPRNPEALSDAEYDKFMSALPTGDDVYVREAPDAPSFVKDMEGVYETVMGAYTRFMLEEDEDMDDPEELKAAGDYDEGGESMIADVMGANATMHLRNLEKNMEEGVMKAVKATEEGLMKGLDEVQRGLDEIGIHIPIERHESVSVDGSDLSDFRDIRSGTGVNDGESDDDTMPSESGSSSFAESIYSVKGGRGAIPSPSSKNDIMDELHDYSARKADSILRDTEGGKRVKTLTVSEDRFSSRFSSET